MAAASSQTVVVVATAAVTASDLTGLSGLSPEIAGLLASTFGALIGTIFWPMARDKPISSIKAIVGYVVVGAFIVHISRDITPAQFALVVQLPRAEEFWNLTTGFRHGILTFALTQLHTIPTIWHRRKR